MSRIKKGFDILSGWYDHILYLTSGNSILRSQLLLSGHFPYNPKTLVLGGGTGSFLLEVLKLQKTKHVVYADISAGMIRESKQKLSSEPAFIKKVDFRTGGVELIRPEEKFDFLVTNYFLDLFTEQELETLIPKLLEHLNKGGCWLVTDFNHGRNRISKPVFSVVTSILYMFFRITCGLKTSRLPDIPKILNRKELHLKHEAFTLMGLLRSALYEKNEA